MTADAKTPTEPKSSWLLHHGEALPTGERVTLTPEQVKARKRRGQWMALALVAFCILVFLITMTKMGASMLLGGS